MMNLRKPIIASSLLIILAVLAAPPVTHAQTTGVIAPTLSISCNPGTVAVNQATQCTASVTSPAPPSPSGTISFSSTSSGTFVATGCTFSPPGPGTCTFGGNSCGFTSGISSTTISCSVSYEPNPGSEGTHSIIATYSGDSVFIPGAIEFSLTVTKRSSFFQITCTPSMLAVNQPTICSGTVSDTSPGTPLIPTGTVTWQSSGAGTFSSASCMLNPISSSASSCSVTYTPSPGSEGTGIAVHGILGTYAGDTDHTGSAEDESLTITRRSTSTSVFCTWGTKCTATVSDTSPGTPLIPTGTVTWSSTASGAAFKPSSCTISGSGSTASCTVTYSPGPGPKNSQTVTATYRGDTDHFGSSGTTTLFA
ncbi:hypothetical protein E6H19_09465 [Candidatus Bathyarchaeota archaeon]|nr:MAG: hypothetical protein E6H30_07675 [Candidatus Bathyarchaeota archaeon]TMI43530.1 MAG: hypothetical protein E6H19_09465 [Candidatus Bathyarchaeota archaeon]